MTERAIGEKQATENPFSLRVTQLPVEEYITSQDDRPIFYVPLRAGDKRLVNNLEMEVMGVCRAEGTATIVFRESQLRPEGRDLDITQIQSDNGIIRLGSDGEIVLRKIKKNDHLVCYIALPTDVDLHSLDHRQLAKSSLKSPVSP